MIEYIVLSSVSVVLLPVEHRLLKLLGSHMDVSRSILVLPVGGLLIALAAFFVGLVIMSDPVGIFIPAAVWESYFIFWLTRKTIESWPDQDDAKE